MGKPWFHLEVVGGVTGSVWDDFRALNSTFSNLSFLKDVRIEMLSFQVEPDWETRLKNKSK